MHGHTEGLRSILMLERSGLFVVCCIFLKFSTFNWLFSHNVRFFSFYAILYLFWPFCTLVPFLFFFPHVFPGYFSAYHLEMNSSSFWGVHLQRLKTHIFFSTLKTLEPTCLSKASPCHTSFCCFFAQPGSGRGPAPAGFQTLLALLLAIPMPNTLRGLLARFCPAWPRVLAVHPLPKVSPVTHCYVCGLCAALRCAVQPILAVCVTLWVERTRWPHHKLFHGKSLFSGGALLHACACGCMGSAPSLNWTQIPSQGVMRWWDCIPNMEKIRKGQTGPNNVAAKCAPEPMAQWIDLWSQRSSRDRILFAH